MQYDAKDPEEYLEKLDEDWRKEKLLKIRELILRESDKISESIEYKMLRFGNEESSVFHLNAQKNYVGLYIGDISKIPESDRLLEGYDKGKGCVRIKKSNDPKSPELVKFIKLAINKWNDGDDLSC